MKLYFIPSSSLVHTGVSILRLSCHDLLCPSAAAELYFPLRDQLATTKFEASFTSSR